MGAGFRLDQWMSDLASLRTKFTQLIAKVESVQE